MTLALAACGGGSGDPAELGAVNAGGGAAGITGTGFISSGTITGFGSVIVNGVRFETQNTTFDVDGDDTAVENDLGVGMVVQVAGTINPDGTTGVATKIVFDEEIQGPVASIVPAENNTRTFTVLGTTVVINNKTVFDKDDDISPSTIFDFSSIADDDNVEISGFFNAAGHLIATRVELEDESFDANSIVEVEGKISELVTNGTRFKIGNLTVEVATSTELDDIPGGSLANNQLVEVEGIFDVVANTIRATKIEHEDDGFADAEDFEIAGLITDFDGNNEFKVNGISIRLTDQTEFEDGAVRAALKNDLHVEVDGEMKNGVLIVEEITFEGYQDVEVYAEITAIDIANKTFTLTPIENGVSIKVAVDYGTQFGDSINDNDRFNFSNLVVGNFVEVEGKNFKATDNSFKATYVWLEELGDYVVMEGIYNSIANGAQLLGIALAFDSNTIFKDAEDNLITQVQFSNQVLNGVTEIEIKSNLENGVANNIANEVKIKEED